MPVAMSPDANPKEPAILDPSADRSELPMGYRPAIVTAITVVLGFSLLFLRFWAFEAPGDWTLLSFASAVVLFTGIVVDVYALWRSLRLEDDNRQEYTKTLNWFVTAISIILVSLVMSAVAYSGLLPQPS